MATKDDSSLLIFSLLLIGAIAALAFAPSDIMATLAYISNYPFGDKDTFANAVVQMANELGISANDIMFVMDNESNHTFDPAIKGAGSNPPVGLIQIEPSTAEGLGTTTAQLATMSATDQLAYIQKYIQKVIDQYGPLNTTSDVYLAVFYPAALPQPATFQFPASVVKDNPIFFKGTSGTKQDFINWVANAIPEQYSDLFTNVSSILLYLQSQY